MVVAWLGIDIGGTKVALRVEREDGGTREVSFRWGRTASPAEDIAMLGRQVRETCDALLARVGVAMPATLDPAGRVTAWPGCPSWTGLDVGATFRVLFGDVEVRCADDGDLAALAEADTAGCADVVYLGVGTGIGGGIVLDGRLIPGVGKGSCEIGHLVIDREGPRCDCGRRGCLQAAASGPATLRRASAARGVAVGYDELRDGWLAEEDWAVAAVGETCAALAVAVSGLAELVRPAKAIVGGGFADGLPGFVPAVGAHLGSLARPGHPPVPVQAAALGGLSSLRGAMLPCPEP